MGVVPTVMISAVVSNRVALPLQRSHTWCGCLRAGDACKSFLLIVSFTSVSSECFIYSDYLFVELSVKYSLYSKSCIFLVELNEIVQINCIFGCLLFSRPTQLCGWTEDYFKIFFLSAFL